MPITEDKNAFVDAGAVSIGFSQMFTVTAGTANPTYLVLTTLDRDEYTAGASGATGWSSRRGMPGRSPYTELDDANTSRRTPWSRAARITFSVPSTFTALEVNGSWIDLGTEGIAPS